MTQDIRFSRDVAGDMLLPLQAKLDAGAGAMKILIYDGTRTATPETGITTQTLLLQTVSSNTTTCATETPTGTLTFANITTGTAESFTSPTSRTATWARFTDSAGNAHMDVDVGLTGAGKFISMVSTTIVANAPVAFTTGGTLTLP
jgi:hypothetical protein